MKCSPKLYQHSQYHIGYVYCIALLIFFCSLTAYGQTDASIKNTTKTNQKLSEIQQRINHQKQTLSNTTVKISDLEQQLKTDDLAIGEMTRKLRKTKQSLLAVRKKISQLADEQQQLQLAKKQQEQILAKQLRAAYSAGHHDYLKLVLNQQKPSSVQRTITHYQYLNAARIKEIETFKITLTKLSDIRTQQQIKAEQFTELTQTQSQQKQILELSKVKQQQTLKALNKKVLSGQQRLSKLEREESNLVALLKKMAKAAKAAENLVGLSKLKRKLSWPVKGRISHSFGSSKQGYLKWKGVFLTAPVGRQVKTIHSGTILFSDWLNGYGLVSVVDHGDGYMSLYGHNQALLKSVGDRVEAGEPIALVGQSGGQADSGLYFEIRHAGKAVNPKLWCR